MFGQLAELPEPCGADGVVVDGVVVDGVVADGVLEDEPLLDEPVEPFAIATTPPAIAPVTSRLATTFRSLITSPPFVVSLSDRSRIWRCRLCVPDEYVQSSLLRSAPLAADGAGRPGRGRRFPGSALVAEWQTRKGRASGTIYRIDG